MLQNLSRRLTHTTLALVLCFFCTQVSPPAEAQEPTSEEAEIDQLKALLRAETDSDKKEKIDREIEAVYLSNPRKETKRLYDAWQDESDPHTRKKIGEELADAAVHSEEPDIVMEVATGGSFAERRIQIPAGTQQLLLRECSQLPPKAGEEVADSGRPYQWVIRRMTADRIEVWLPNHGWLFDSQGELLSEAFPPRRDADGRGWFGAFLPDGSWVTTDLWGDDKVLTFFSREGKWLKEINATDLVPHKNDGERDDGDGDTSISTIGWCRCDAVGDGFVVSVGQGSGRGVAWVNAKGEHHLLRDGAAPWKLCYPRDLERKGMYTHLYIPSDRGDEWFESHTPGHGLFCGYPTLEALNFQVMIRNGETFGFWPDSSSLWIGIKDETFGTDSETGGAIEQLCRTNLIL